MENFQGLVIMVILALKFSWGYYFRKSNSNILELFKKKIDTWIQMTENGLQSIIFYNSWEWSNAKAFNSWLNTENYNQPTNITWAILHELNRANLT